MHYNQDIGKAEILAETTFFAELKDYVTQMQTYDDLYSYPALKHFDARVNNSKPVVPVGYTPAERLDRAIRRTEPGAAEKTLALDNADLLQHLHRPSPQFRIINELVAGQPLPVTRENSYIDQINEYYLMIANWWNKTIGGVIDMKHVARILEQFPPFIDLC